MTDTRTGQFNREELREEDARSRQVRGSGQKEPTRYWGDADPAGQDSFYQAADYSYAEYPGGLDADGVYHPAEGGEYGDPGYGAYDRSDDSGESTRVASPRESFHDIPRKRKKHRRKHYLLRLLIVIAVLLALAGFLSSSVFDVKKYEVKGNHYYSDQEVRNIADVQTGVNIFSRSNVKAIEKRLLANPYYTAVKVKRKLPSTMVIQVTERRQAAAFIYGDSYIVIDSSGTVLRKTDVEPEITLLEGFHLSRIDVGKKVRVEESSMLDQTLDLLRSTRKGDFYFKQIDASEVMVTGHITDALVVKGSPKQMKKVIDSGDLQKVVSNLFRSGTKRGTLNIGEENYISFSPKL